LGTYNVRVKARDIWGAGSIWSEPLAVTITDNNPPDTPEITGPGQGEPGNPYLYNVRADDLDGHDLYYFIDWGDGTNSSWLGPYVSGTQIHETHTWTEEGNYTIRAKTKDILDMESEWGALQVTMPTEYQFSLQTFLQHLFDRFPRMFPILRYLLGY
jgi:hypothetical protein